MSDLHIGTLCVRGKDSAAVRLRLAHLLGNLHLPHAPHAILLTRQLTKPVLMSLATTRRIPHLSHEQAATIRHLLAEAHRCAARPHNGVIVGTPNSIRFADDAEALACLLRIWGQRHSATPWWYRSLLRYWRVPDVRAAFLQQHRIIPATFALLTEWQSAESVAQQLDDAICLAILTVTLKAFALEDVAQIFGRLYSTQLPMATPIWQPWVSVSANRRQMNRPQSALLGMMRMLYNQPARLRAPDTIAALRQWWETTPSTVEMSQQRLASADDKHAQAHNVTEQTRRGDVSTASTLDKPTVSTAERDPITDAPHPVSNPDRANITSPKSTVWDDVSWTTEGLESGGDAPSAAADGACSADMPFVSAEAAMKAQAFKDTLSIGRSPAPNNPTSPQQQPDADHAVYSQLGGVFYLINVLVALKLDVLHIDPWRQLADIAQQLLAEQDADYTHDALWQLLEQLAKPKTMPQEGAGPSLLPQILAHMAQIAPSVDITLMLTIPARIFVTRTHLDIMLPLDAIALPVRLAGLDFNPGWLPLWGRVVLFHYE